MRAFPLTACYLVCLTGERSCIMREMPHYFFITIINSNFPIPPIGRYGTICEFQCGGKREGRPVNGSKKDVMGYL